MKLFLIIIIVLCIVAGCASIRVDEQTGVVEYKRFGNQELHGILIEFEKSQEGFVKLKASLGEQKSEREIAEVLLAISENVDKALQIIMEIQSKFPSLNIGD